VSNFKSAFNEGLEAAQKAKAARLEIDNVFKDLNQQLTEVSEGKLTIAQEQLELPRPWAAQLATLLEPPEKYWAIVARNPTIEGSSFQELCKWESGRAGYPCKLTWGGNEHYCEDKQALENTLSNLLRDPIIAEKLVSLMDLKVGKKHM
jgi:hypothetical protein